jgi:hypothetical protein
MEHSKTTHLRRLSKLMDSQFQLGGFRFGLDGLIGLIPGLGDIVTTAVSLYIIFQGARLGCSPSVLVRMGLNLAFENLLDIIPIIGNIADFVWKANSKNVALIEGHIANAPAVRRQTRWVLALIVFVIVSLLAATLTVTILLIKALMVALEKVAIGV